MFPLTDDKIFKHLEDTYALKLLPEDYFINGHQAEKYVQCELLPKREGGCDLSDYHALTVYVRPLGPRVAHAFKLYISEGTKKEQQVVVRTIQDIDRAIHHWSMTNYDAYSRAARAKRQAELLAKQVAAEEKENTMMRKRVLFSP
jgi:hypothetical protein